MAEIRKPRKKAKTNAISAAEATDQQEIKDAIEAENTPVFISSDAESFGFSGGAFAVGATVHRIPDGAVLQKWFASCSMKSLPDYDPARADCKWLEAHVIPALNSTAPSLNGLPLHITHAGPRPMRDAFWHFLVSWKNSKRLQYLVSDCGSIENKLLLQLREDNIKDRDKHFHEWPTPFCPVHELASVFFVKKGNSDTTAPRLPSEEPAHHPTLDALQSGRLWCELFYGKEPADADIGQPLVQAAVPVLAAVGAVGRAPPAPAELSPAFRRSVEQEVNPHGLPKRTGMLIATPAPATKLISVLTKDGKARHQFVRE